MEGTPVERSDVKCWCGGSSITIISLCDHLREASASLSFLDLTIRSSKIRRKIAKVMAVCYGRRACPLALRAYLPAVRCDGSGIDFRLVGSQWCPSDMISSLFVPFAKGPVVVEFLRAYLFGAEKVTRGIVYSKETHKLVRTDVGHFCQGAHQSCFSALARWLQAIEYLVDHPDQFSVPFRMLRDGPLAIPNARRVQFIRHKIWDRIATPNSTPPRSGGSGESQARRTVPPPIVALQADREGRIDIIERYGLDNARYMVYSTLVSLAGQNSDLRGVFAACLRDADSEAIRRWGAIAIRWHFAGFEGVSDDLAVLRSVGRFVPPPPPPPPGASF